MATMVASQGEGVVAGELSFLRIVDASTETCVLGLKHRLIHEDHFPRKTQLP